MFEDCASCLMINELYTTPLKEIKKYVKRTLKHLTIKCLQNLSDFLSFRVYFIFIYDRIKIPILYQHVLLKDGTVKFAFVLCLFSLTDLCK